MLNIIKIYLQDIRTSQLVNLTSLSANLILKIYQVAKEYQ